MMKMLLWAIVAFAATGFAFWFVTSTATVSPHPLLIIPLGLIFCAAPLGTFWMLYMVIRHEGRPLPYILLAFIPFFFLGYYFERIRGKRLGNGSRFE
jgi:hypothetical protein